MRTIKDGFLAEVCRILTREKDKKENLLRIHHQAGDLTAMDRPMPR
jgi:hypothetical protein